MTQRHLQIQYCTLAPGKGIILHIKSQGAWFFCFFFPPSFLSNLTSRSQFFALTTEISTLAGFSPWFRILNTHQLTIPPPQRSFYYFVHVTLKYVCIC